MIIANLRHIVTVLVISISLSGCSILPSGYEEEKAHYADLTIQYSKTFDERQLYEFSSTPTWKDVLERAFLVNGDLEAAYFDWKASLEKVRSDSEYPNTSVMLGYSYLFSKANMKAFDRSSFSLGFNPMTNLSFPTKVALSGKIAFDDALSKGQRITTTKFALQKSVLSDWADYTGLSLKLLLAQEKENLFVASEHSSLTQQVVGGNQRDALQGGIKASESRSIVLSLQAKVNAERAKLNGMLARSMDGELDAPATVEARMLTASDSEVIRASVTSNPELSSFANELEGKKDALELARQQWIPDINPSALLTGNIEQSVGANIMLPTTIIKIRHDVAQAKSAIQASEAMLRQAKLSKAASLIGALVIVRDFERQIDLYQKVLIPSAELLSKTAQVEYETGVKTFADTVDSQLMLISLREELIDTQTEHAKMISELEELMGVDIEMLAQDAGQSVERKENEINS